MRAAIISRQGLGDGLIMMIAAYHLKKNGYRVSFYHRLFHELRHFFEGYEFQDLKEDIDIFSSYELIIIEHYNHPFIKKLIEILRKKRKKNRNLYVIYPTQKKKYFLCDKNFICDNKKSIAENICILISKILNENNLVKKTNGINPPDFLHFKKNKKRVIIHPTSNDIRKNWRKKRFIKLFFRLKKYGYQPIFSLAPHELKDWKNEKIDIVCCDNFHELASLIYESGYLIGNDSGPAHLASNLNIPTIVIASNYRTMRLWRPDFSNAELITASSFIPNPKFLRIRNKYWAFFVSTKNVLKKLKKISSN